MTNNKRRLLKDLPFSNVKKGDVIWRGNRCCGGEFSISGGKTFYSGGGSSEKGTRVFDNLEADILKKIWDDGEWFEDADLKHIEVVVRNGSITLRFDPIDIEDAEDFAKGIIHILPHLKDKGWAWDKFGDLTTEIKNN